MLNWYKRAQENAFQDEHDKYHSEYEEQWQHIIEEKAQENPYPFANWFPEGSSRVYIPFFSETDTADANVEDLLKESGYIITDYRQGYCQDNYGRTMRIGKVLQQLWKKDLAKQVERHSNEEIYNLERAQEETNTYYQRIIDTFTNSPLRMAKDQARHNIVISQDPHDVAQMSTGRNWTSCMTLGTGEYHTNVFCDVAQGTLIAYLVNTGDQDIQKPLARILIRRFVNELGESIAIPEESVYGDDISGFQQAVNQWLDERQPSINAGLYTRKGGSYSDTFDTNHYVTPTDPQELIDMFHLKDVNPVVEYIVTDNLKETINEAVSWDNNEYHDSRTTFSTEEEAKEFVKYNSGTEEEYYLMEHLEGYNYFGETDEENQEEINKLAKNRFEIRSRTVYSEAGIRDIAMREIINSPVGTFPQDVLTEVKQLIFNIGNPLYDEPIKNVSPAYTYTGLKRKFLEKYPSLITDDDLKSVQDEDVAKHVAGMPEGDKKEEMKRKILYDILDYLHTETNRIKHMHIVVSTGVNFTPQEYTNFSQIVLKPLEHFDKINESIIQGLLNYIEQAERLYEESKKTGESFSYLHDYYQWLLRDVSAIFWKTKSDTPSVQNFYQDRIQEWDLVASHNTFGFAISQLGENGQQFIPFFKEQVKKVEQALKELHERNRTKGLSSNPYIKQYNTLKEQYLYIIDKLEHGVGYQSKYRWAKENTSWWHKKANLI